MCMTQCVSGCASHRFTSTRQSGYAYGLLISMIGEDFLYSVQKKLFALEIFAVKHIFFGDALPDEAAQER